MCFDDSSLIVSLAFSAFDMDLPFIFSFFFYGEFIIADARDFIIASLIVSEYRECYSLVILVLSGFALLHLCLDRWMQNESLIKVSKKL